VTVASVWFSSWTRRPPWPRPPGAGPPTSAAVEDPARELVDDLHLAVDDRVVDVALVERLGLQGLVEVVDERAVLGLVEVVDAEELLGLGDALLGDRDRLVLLVELVVVVGDELLLGLRVHPLRLLAGTISGASLAKRS
jgi:hypothetical protein